VKVKESNLQQDCVKYFNYQYPKLADLYFAIPNGMWAKNIGTAIKQKKEGMKPGVLDTFLMYPSKEYHGLWIEFKVGNNKPTAHQKNFISNAITQGFKVEVVYNFDQFKQTIESYL